MTNTFQLTITAKPTLGIIERIMRVIRHRGGEMTECHLKQNQHEIIMNMTISSPRESYLFANQLKKLMNIQSVELLKE